jgi:hypothetical protein
VDTDNDNFLARENAKGHNYIDKTKLPDYACMPYWRLAHFHPEDKTKARFFRDIEDAIAEKYLVCKLTRFLITHCELPIEECEDFLVDCGYYSGKAEFDILRDADAIERAYTDGPSSCMNDPDEYPLPSVHPARCYASPDLGLAIVKREGECTARAVVCPERKIFATIYGHSKLLEGWLKEQGYRRTRAWSAWRGLRLMKIKYDEFETILCPYLDMSDTVSKSRDGKYLRIAGPHGAYGARNCDGYLADNDNGW